MTRPIGSLLGDPSALRLGLPARTPRIVVERLRPFFLADPDFASTLLVQLDVARAELFARPSSPGLARPIPRSEAPRRGFVESPRPYPA